jgi:hypothetical protein
MDPKEKITVDEAVSIIKRDYYDDVREIVENLKQAIKDGEVTDEDGAYDWLHQSIDGSARVIYTWQAKLGLLVSDNEDAYEDEIGEPAPSVESRMYMAMMRDVLDTIGDLSDLFEAEQDNEGEDK